MRFALVVVLLCLLGPALAQAQTPAQAGWGPDGPQRARLDSWVHIGFDEPDRALAALKDAAWAENERTQDRRDRNLAQALILAAAGRSTATEAVVSSMLADEANDPLASGHAALLRAMLADNRGEGKAVLESVQHALRVFERMCPAHPGCDYRQQWRALMLVSRYDQQRGQTATALTNALAAVSLAKTLADQGRLAWSMAQAADLMTVQGDGVQGQRLLSQAQRMARTEGSLALLSRLQAFQAIGHSRQGDGPSALRAAAVGLRLAQSAQSPRLQALHQTNLSDAYIKAGRPREALQAVQNALPTVQRFGNLRAERTLQHNAALARVALGQSQAARQAMQQVLAAYRSNGASADEVDALREFADAFAAVGDTRTALDLYHQERQLAATIMAANRDTALAELRLRFDREAQQKQLQQLARASSLQSAQLDNRALLQKVWATVAVALLLAMALVVVLYRRVRSLNRSLASNQAFLRAQSQRDPLTGLANRRGLHDAAVSRGVDAQFTGAMLLVDIDHFKHVNDGHGHAAGDSVLVEIARRLIGVVRSDDVVARWGGEEFLIYMPGVEAQQAQAQAERVLHAVGGQPVPLAAAGQTLKVTVSVGYGAFPLPGARLPLSLERAINLADMALYTAKGQGRNRAIGVVAAQADDDTALRALEANFDHAWHEGRLTLQRSLGPATTEVRESRPAPLAMDAQAASAGAEDEAEPPSAPSAVR